MSNTSAQVRKREPRSRLRSRLAIVAGLTVPALALAACSSSGGTTTPSASTSASSSAAAEPVTLSVQSGDGGSDALLKGYAALNKAFEAAHPGVTS